MNETDNVSAGNKQAVDIAVALQKFDRSSLEEDIQKAEEERKQIIARFPLEDWPTMPLERYALGLGVKDTFSWWMEWGTDHLGSISGGSAEKHLIYKHRTKGWVYDSDYHNELEAWEAIRSAFVNAFQLARQGKFDEIEALEPFKRGYAIVVKVMYVYFPEQFLPIFSAVHTTHFLQVLNHPLKGRLSEWRGVKLNRALLEAVQEQPGLKDLSHLEVMWFLYQFYDPRIAQHIVKIAPGENAKYWNECLAGGYTCVQEANWDEIGDLRDYDSEESFVEDFVKHNLHYASRTLANKKAQELWMLRELEAGDLVVANKGISHVLAIGIVKDPGYKWNPERTEAWHTVEVDWDTSVEGEIEPQKRWESVTVAKVSRDLYQKIITRKPPTSPNVTRLPSPPVDPSFREIAEALERKGQVILYGPPGTGKTYTARRFAVWWLRHHNRIDIEALPADPATFSEAEKNLTTVQLNRRVWWVVANPTRWKWDTLFANNREEFSYGRIKRNYPLVQRGDLVIGYQANPDKRIVALAKVSREFGPGEDGQLCVGVVPVAKISHGLTFDELVADPVLKGSEPMRSNNQGTLFTLTEEEAQHLFTRLVEKNPALSEQLELGEEEDSIGQLTFLTFHPSYSYEDFIEGFKPSPSESGNGSLQLRLEDGLFKRVCRQAQANPRKSYLVLIDEINRANIAKVFGELITLLEKDKRGLSVILPQSKEAFTIPDNVYLLATMNTADKSIKLLDAALRRRFAFKELMPDSELLRGATINGLFLDVFLEELNRRIARTEGREKQIGHAYLLEADKPIESVEEFARRFQQEILPLLQEYCYDDYTELAQYIGEKLVDKEGQTLNQAILRDSNRLLETLADEFKLENAAI